MPELVDQHAFEDLSDREWELVHTTYAQAMESLERNEEMGERRLGLLFTVASAAALAVGLVADGSATDDAKLWTGAGAAISVGLLGLLTVSRLARRNLKTTELIGRLHEIRCDAVNENPRLEELFVYSTAVEPRPRTQAPLPTKGGLVDIAGCATAAFLGGGALLALRALEVELGVAAICGAALAIAAWALQVRLVRRVYLDAAPGSGSVIAGDRT